jgi:hypothetical protein
LKLALKFREDPMTLLKELKKQGITTEISSKFKLTPQGLRLVEADVKGKPQEATLSKVYNVVRKAKELTSVPEIPLEFTISECSISMTRSLNGFGFFVLH